VVAGVAVLLHKSSSVSRNKDEDSLIRWIEREGGFVHPQIEIRNGLHGRGVFLKAPLAKGERVLSVPETCLFSIKAVRERDPRLAFSQVDYSLVEQESESVLLALALIAERSQQENSFWRPYLGDLPATYPEQPLFWTSLAELQSQIVSEQITMSREFLQSKLSLLEQLAAKYPQLYHQQPSDKLLDEFTWAYYTVVSRAFDVPGGRDNRGKPDPEDYVTGLVPFCDLLNHAYGADTAKRSLAFLLPKRDVHFVMTPTMDLLAGSELMWKYQDSSKRPSTKSLYRYGMLNSDFEERVEGDYVLLKWSDGRRWTVGADGKILDWEDHMVQDGFVGELASKVAAAIKALPTSLEHDKTLLALPSSTIPVTALLLRIRYKQVLHKLLEWLQTGAPPPDMTEKDDFDRPPLLALFQLDLS